MAYYSPTSQQGTIGSIYLLPQPYTQPQGQPVGGINGLAPGANTNPTGVTYQTVDPNALTSNQITGLLAGDNPYIENARAQGVQYGASRGLLNSAMSAGTSENAAIGAALPIAQANASEIAGVNAANQQAANQYVGENIAAQAQVEASQSQITAAQIQSDERAQEAKQQFQEYGMGLGLNYAQLGENDKQFLMSFGQHGAEFQAQLDQGNKQFEQSLAQQMTEFNTGVGEYMTNMDFQKYALGVTQNAQNSHDYATAFMNYMLDPNMTADQRTNALSSTKDFFGQLSQYTMAGTAFIPPWSSNPDFWSTDWTGGTTGP